MKNDNGRVGKRMSGRMMLVLGVGFFVIGTSGLHAAELNVKASGDNDAKVTLDVGGINGWYIGLDDTDDGFKIGTGTAVGGTSARLTIDSSVDKTVTIITNLEGQYDDPDLVDRFQVSIAIP